MSLNSDDDVSLIIRRQEAGKFDRRLLIGPARWPHFDLLWIHSGEVRIDVGESPTRLVLTAPSGLLIAPGTPFAGRSLTATASASICHFDCSDARKLGFIGDFCVSGEDQSFHIQNLINLSLSYVERQAPMTMRHRLLRAILDCLMTLPGPEQAATRVDRAWRQARDNLHRVRGLTDVAASIGLTESTFRALHKKQFGSSAGHYLREMRLMQAERLLATTGDTVANISKSVGYAQAESFSHAFSSTRGRTPAAYRRWCKRFA